MIRKFLSVFIALFVVFVTQSQVFAATKQIDETQKTILTYTMNNTQTVLDEEVQAPYQLAETKTNADMSEYIWIASIFVAGLGQILMGDVSGGLWWMFKVYLLPTIIVIVASFLLMSSSNNSSGYSTYSTPSFVTLIGGIVCIVFYIMNILDAYNMSQDKLSAIQIQEKLAELQNMQKFAENVSLRDGNISYKVLAF